MTLHSPLTRGILRLITAYQKTVSPDHGRLPLVPGGRCRFYPSCSEYARQAISRHGLRRGGLLALSRLGRCHPWSAGGVDLVQ